MHSWGAVTQPIQPISFASSSFLAEHSPSTMIGDNSLSYTSSYETKLRMSATNSYSPHYNAMNSSTNSSSNNNTNMNALSLLSDRDRIRVTSNESKSQSNNITNESDNINIIRTRPMSAGRSYGEKVNINSTKTAHLNNSQAVSISKETSINNDGIPSVLALKAKELEAELDTYRSII
jgi:hypothetical protein